MATLIKDRKVVANASSRSSTGTGEVLRLEPTDDPALVADRAGEDAAEALAAFDDFSESYQAKAARPVPLFRRRA